MTTVFQPPPTWALPVVVDETSGKAVFSPVWLKWFVDLSRGLSTGGAGSGTVTSVAALTLVTTGTDLSSTVVNSTTTPVITLGVPTASATKRGALSAADWTTFNSKQSLVAPVTKTANFSVATTETWLINNKAGSTCTVTLPVATTFAGRLLAFKNLQAQTLVSASSNVVPIDTAVAGTAILLGVIGNWATLVSDGTNWIIMQQAPNNALLLE